MTAQSFKNSAGQGDIIITRIDALPSGNNIKEVAAPDGLNYVAHSETGHHHVMERAKATMFENTDNALEAFLVVHRQAELKHTKSGPDAHAGLKVEPGVYRIIRQVEYTPQGYRQVID